jgi:Na+/phosphate symporter|tara:strand:- start:798 stop:1055 length:258 start_codon:yes stop_codon:yes gene_type:complete
MNRKFVTENKRVLREFFIDMLKSLVSKRAISNLDKIIDADPELKKEKDAIVRMSNSLRKKVQKAKKDDPAQYKRFLKNPLLKKYA